MSPQTQPLLTRINLSLSNRCHGLLLWQTKSATAHHANIHSLSSWEDQRIVWSRDGRVPPISGRFIVLLMWTGHYGMNQGMGIWSLSFFSVEYSQEDLFPYQQPRTNWLQYYYHHTLAHIRTGETTRELRLKAQSTRHLMSVPQINECSSDT